LLEEKL